MRMTEIKEGYTRVSEFCSRYEDFSSVDQDYLASRALVGSNVHFAIHSYLNFMPFKLSVEELGYFESWMMWYDNTKCKITHDETRMYCDTWKLTGAIDGIVTFPGSDDNMIVDWKTSSYANDDIWSLKGGFYSYLVKGNKLCEISDRVLYIKLDKAGKAPKVCEYEITSQIRNLVIATMMTHRFEERVKTSKTWRK
jgi:hypothetical protein